MARLADDIARERRRRASAAKRAVVEYATELYALVAALSPKQRALHTDKSEQICVVCTRQSGKTSEALLRILEVLTGAPGRIAYVCMPTRDRARDTFWDRWKEATRPFGLGDEHHHETLLETRFPNGSILRLVGVPDKKRADRIRGQTLDLIVIDEAANFADDVLQYLVEHCCSAALGIRRGSLYVCSTPGMEPTGYLYRLYTDHQLEFSRHFLSLADNPAWKDPDAYLAKVRRQFGYTEDDPTYQREWLGRWVADLSRRVYRLTDENLIAEAPACDHHVMALDLGATDESAICVLGWKAGARTLYCVHEEAEGELDITSVAERVKALQAIYQPLVTMVDGAAKQSVLELENRHGIPLEATPKAPNYKAKAIAQANADFRRRSVLIPRSFALVGQMRALQWAAKAVGVREHPGQPNDRCFVAGTLITTNRGEIPIENVRVGDLALTRHGYFPVLASGSTGESETLTVRTALGKEITGTHGHPVLTSSGWVMLAELGNNAILYACHTSKDETVIGESGSGRTDQSPRASSFTTRTATNGTTIYPTSNVSSTQSTRGIILRKIGAWLRETTSRRLSPRHQVGTVLPRDEHGIVTMLIRSALRFAPSIAFAWCVEKAFRQSTPMLMFARTPALLSDAGPAASTTSSLSALNAENRSCATGTPSRVVVPDRVVSVTEGGRQRVFNLTVATAHEYFANGLLVSNCDAFLYAYLRALHYVEQMPEKPTEPWKLEQAKIREERERRQAASSLDPWATPDPDW